MEVASKWDKFRETVSVRNVICGKGPFLEDRFPEGIRRKSKLYNSIFQHETYGSFFRTSLRVLAVIEGSQ
jgi:hypothetical protein